VTPGLVSALFVGAALFAFGLLAAARQRDALAAIGGVAVMLGGAGVELVAGTRFAAATHDSLGGQELAVLLAVVALAVTVLGVGLATREPAR
jgi:NADH:ubiquinone oxidoreductase subunit K